jgi:gamma-glutamyltranspeptidase
MRNPDGPVTGRPATLAPNGMVATSHTLASQAGLDMLRRKGSAVDAVIAANAVLCVVYPHMAGLGGDGFWLIAEPGRDVRALNGSGPAATAATIDHYREQGHTDEIPSRGAAAALTVPGAVDGWRELHEAYGRLDWDELFAAAIGYARRGAPIGRSLADWIAQDVDVLGAEERTAELYLRDGRPLRLGDRFAQPDLASTLDAIAMQGARELYEGATAERLAAALERTGSPLRGEDLEAFRAEWVQPIRTTYRGLEMLSFPPNTQGFAALQILNLIEGFDVVGWGDGTADYYHHMAEAVKLAFADRDAWLTDPAFVDIPTERFLTKDYADERRGRIDPTSAMKMDDVEPGIAPPTAGGRRSVEGDTCAFCAVDGDGLAVSAIQSIYHDFGSGVIAGDTGVLMQNRGSFFSLDEEHPNHLEPGKRTFHTLIPSMTLRDGEPELVFGSMGGEGQPQTQAAIVTRLEDFGYDVQQAIEAPRWLMGRTWGVESRDLSLEGRISDEVARELEFRGQPVKMLPNWDDNMGHAQAIRIDRERGLLEGGADPRGDGAAVGY